MDLIDAASGKLVWRGMVKDVLHTDPRKREKTVRTRVAEMFKKFPPRVTLQFLQDQSAIIADPGFFGQQPDSLFQQE